MTAPQWSAGVTLVEILVALTVLAVGAVALSAWQLASLHAAAQAGKLQQLNALVEAELRYRTLVPASAPHCIVLADLQPAAAAQPITCGVTMEACHFDTAAVHCSPHPVSGPPPRVRRITVSAGFAGSAAPYLELSSLAAGFPLP